MDHIDVRIDGRWNGDRCEGRGCRGCAAHSGVTPLVRHAIARIPAALRVAVLRGRVVDGGLFAFLTALLDALRGGRIPVISVSCGCVHRVKGCVKGGCFFNSCHPVTHPAV